MSTGSKKLKKTVILLEVNNLEDSKVSSLLSKESSLLDRESLPIGEIYLPFNTKKDLPKIFAWLKNYLKQQIRS